MYPCNSVEQTFKEPCYLIQTAYALRQTGQDFAKVFDMCGAVEEDMRDTCWQSLGRDASGNSVSNISITRERCELGKNNRSSDELCHWCGKRLRVSLRR
jgi:hypothetical protein